MRVLNKIALILIIIGALNWGLIGFFEFNLISAIFGVGSVVNRILYALVGIAGLWSLGMLFDGPQRREAGEYETT